MDFTLLFTMTVLHCMLQTTQGSCNEVAVNVIDIVVITILLEIYLVLWAFQLF